MALELVESVSAGSANATTRKKSNELDKDAFLLLLTKQMQNQDPLEPMDNSQFVAQMSQFSTLEQITNMSKSVSNLVSALGQNYKTEAMTYLGMTVTAVPTGEIEPITGNISSVRFEDGEAVFTLNDRDIRLGEITKVEFPS